MYLLHLPIGLLSIVLPQPILCSVTTQISFQLEYKGVTLQSNPSFEPNNTRFHYLDNLQEGCHTLRTNRFLYFLYFEFLVALHKVSYYKLYFFNSCITLTVCPF